MKESVMNRDQNKSFQWAARAIAMQLAMLVLVCGTASRGSCANLLWLAEHFDAKVESFTSSQLNKTGTPTPGGIVDIAATGLAFDGSKNLWVVTGFENNQVQE